MYHVSVYIFLRLLAVLCQRLNEAEIKIACTDKYVSQFIYGSKFYCSLSLYGREKERANLHGMYSAAQRKLLLIYDSQFMNK